MYEYRVPPFHRVVPEDEIRRRIDALQQRLIREGIDALLIVYQVDLFYFTGTMQSGHLLVPARGAPLLLIRKELSRAKAESPLSDVAALTSLKGLPDAVRGRLGREPWRIGMELDVLPVNIYRRYQALWPSTELVDASSWIMEIRSIKSDWEIEAMGRAGELSRSLYARIPELVRPGMSEIELAGRITDLAFREGHQNYLHTRTFNQTIYTWHVISGESGGILSSVDAPFSGYGLSPAFPLGASRKTILPGEPILVDFGICLDGYQVDLTRMFCLGKPPGESLAAYEALGQIEAMLLDRLRPGVPGEALFEMAVAMGKDLGFKEAFLGPPGLKTRFVGHGVGLEISEPPFLAAGHRSPLREGMTVALELKMVFPGKYAVGLENTVRILKEGAEKLTPADEVFTII